MDFSLTRSQKLMKESVRDWFKKYYPLDRVNEADKKGHPFPKDVVKGLANLGIIMGTVPKEHGGAGLDWQTQVIIAEEVGYGDPTIATAAALMAVETGWGFTIDRYARKEVREKYVKPAMKGDKFVGIATTEAGGGSDIAALKTAAKKERNKWVLNGEKTFISGTEEAKMWGGGYWVLARTSPAPTEAPWRGMTAFFVPIDSEGLEVTKPYRDAGRMAISTAGFKMEGVRVPEEYMFGEEGTGFYLTMEGFDNARLLVAASAVGVTRRIIDEAIPYIRERKTFGIPLAKYEAIQFELADSYKEMEAAMLLCMKTAWMQDIRYKEEGMPEKISESKTFKPTEIAKWISMCKWKASRLALKTAERAMLWLGAAGYTDEYPFEMAWRGVMSYVVGAEGGENIQKLVIGRELLGREYLPYR